MSQDKTYSVAHCRCSGCQACIEMCPELFAWDDIREEVVVRKECADADALAKAVAYCPNDCIDVDSDDDNGSR